MRYWMILLSSVLAAHAGPIQAADWFVAPEGKEKGNGSLESPWDIHSALGGAQKIAPGDTIWLLGGVYKHPNRTVRCGGFEVRLAGAPEKPIHVRAVRGERVTLDGGVAVLAPSTHLWIWDLEILVSENSTLPRRINESGSHPESYGRPWGGLTIQAGNQCKYINLVIHDNAQGVSFWTGAVDSELYGCLIHDNGWDAPDRGHGHAIYTQNQSGIKTISDCIMTGGYGYTMHAYGSSKAYVDNYLLTGNICYSGGQFLVGGGRPSRNIRVLDNLLYKVDLRLGYSAPENEDCEVRGNVLLGGGLQINKFKSVTNEQNLIAADAKSAPAEPNPRVVLRPNRYDSNRMHLAVFNWQKRSSVDVDLGKFAGLGETIRLVDPRDFFGKPVLEKRSTGQPISIPLSGEFAAFVVQKRASKRS